jgi:putative endonuclease
LVFVEVRLRVDERFGGAAASVTLAKQRRIALAASHFLSARTEDPLVRFDVLTLDALDSASITWLKAAFDA